MTFPDGASQGGDDRTPWERACVSIQLREKAMGTVMR